MYDFLKMKANAWGIFLVVASIAVFSGCVKSSAMPKQSCDIMKHDSMHMTEKSMRTQEITLKKGKLIEVGLFCSQGRKRKIP